MMSSDQEWRFIDLLQPSIITKRYEQTVEKVDPAR